MRDPTYWTTVVAPGELVLLVRKYRALRELAGMPPGPARAAALRTAARSWPGCLREAELAGPAVCRDRLEQARAGLSHPARTRAAWARPGGPEAALPLWLDAHALLSDQLRWRGVGGRGGHGDFLRAIAGTPAAARWPDARTLEELAGSRVRSRQAYLWLAARAGLPLAELYRLLFARSGHWEQRPDDPT